MSQWIVKPLNTKEKAEFSECFCKMAYRALYRTGSIFGSILQQFLRGFAAKTTFFSEAQGTKNSTLQKKLHKFLFLANCKGCIFTRDGRCPWGSQKANKDLMVWGDRYIYGDAKNTHLKIFHRINWP